MAEIKPKSLVVEFANKYNVEATKLLNTLKNTAFKQAGNNQVTDEQMMALLVVANEYNLNPFTKEIYAFPSNGGVTPIVPIDGWMKIINDHPNFDGMTFKDDADEKGNITAITCSMYRKDRKHPVEVIEYMKECARNTQPWKQWPARMLRHKAAIQAARYAFSFSGIYDPDEGDRIKESEVKAKEEPKCSPDQQEHFFMLLEKGDGFGMYCFKQSFGFGDGNVTDSGLSAWASLFNKFEKGSKTKQTALVNELVNQGCAIANEYAGRVIESLAVDDNSAILEVLADLVPDELQAVKLLLNSEELHALESIAREA